MNHHIIVEFINMFCAGVLAGAEVVVRYGVRVPLTVLDQGPQIQLRQALIRRLRVLVPVIFVSTALSSVAVTVLDGSGTGLWWRWAGVLAVLAWAVITFTGTVPINKATLGWAPAAPPDNWRTLVRRWERLDTARTWAAVLAFAFFLSAVALRLAEI